MKSVRYEDTLKRLKKEDLKIGLHINIEQLEDIFNMWVYIVPTNDEKTEGTIAYFTDDQNDKGVESILSSNPDILLLYKVMDNVAEVYVRD